MIDKSLSQYKKKKKPKQLVSKRKDGKRPGYYGPDAGHENDPGHGSNSSSGSGGNGGSDDNHYMDYYVSPAPEPAPQELSVQEYMEDYATNVGTTASTTGGWESDTDSKEPTVSKYITKKPETTTTPSVQGRNWYGDYDPNNTTGWQEKGLHMDSQGNESNPVDRGEMSSGEYQMKLQGLETQKYMTDYGTNVMKTAVPTGGFQRESTLSNILSPQNIKFPDVSGIKSFITEPQTGWKKAGKGVLNALAYGMFPGLSNMYLQAKGLTKLADRFGLTKEPVRTADTYGVKSRVKPPREPGGDGDSTNTGPKNVIESGQKLIAGYTMDQWRNIQQRRDLLEAYNRRGQLNEKGQMTLLEMNKMIDQYLV